MVDLVYQEEISFVNLEVLAPCTASQTNQGKDPWSILQHVEFVTIK